RAFAAPHHSAFAWLDLLRCMRPAQFATASGQVRRGEKPLPSLETHAGNALAIRIARAYRALQFNAVERALERANTMGFRIQIAHKPQIDRVEQRGEGR